MRLKKNLSKSKDGNTLIEFALLAPVFFMLIAGMVEFVLYHYKLYALNHVVYEATRNLQTGETQNWSDGDDTTTDDMSVAFHNEVCAHAYAMIDCETIIFDVRNFNSIGAVTYPPVTYDENGNPTNFVFQPGGPKAYSVVRAAMPHQFVTPFMNKVMGLEPGGSALINSYSIVRNEPWT